MDELEKAHLLLDLKPGASLKEIDEAREDLLTLWDPKRLSDQPRLKARAARKISEVQAAYKVLAAHVTQATLQKPRELTVDALRSVPEGEAGATSKRPASPAVTAKDKPSLFMETFGQELSQNGRWTPFRMMVAVSVAGILAIGFLAFFVDFGSQTAPSASEAAPAGVSELATREPLVGEVGEEGEAVDAELSESAAGASVEGAAGALTEGTSPVPPAQPSEAQTAGSPNAQAARAAASPAPPSDQTASVREARGAPAAPPATQRPSAAQSERERKSSSPVLVREETEASGPSEAETADLEKERAQRHERAYRILQEQSPVAARLVQGGLDDLQFLSWSAIRETPSEVWINLTARRRGGTSELQLTWSVNLESERVRALSQAARDFAAPASGQ